MRANLSIKSQRFEELRKRKNFLPSLVITAVLWLLFIAVILFTTPDSTPVLFVFFILLFLSLLFTFALILANRRRGLWVALSVTLFLLLRSFGVGNIINLVLLIVIPIIFEFYFSRRA